MHKLTNPQPCLHPQIPWNTSYDPWYWEPFQQGRSLIFLLLLLPFCLPAAALLSPPLPTICGLVAGIPLPTNPVQASTILSTLYNIHAVSPMEPPSPVFFSKQALLTFRTMPTVPFSRSPTRYPCCIIFHVLYVKMAYSSATASRYWVPAIATSCHQVPRKLQGMCFSSCLQGPYDAAGNTRNMYKIVTWFTWSLHLQAFLSHSSMWSVYSA